MTIKPEDIDLRNFLKKFTPQFLSEESKQILDDALFMQIAALLKLDFTLQRLIIK